MLGRRCSQRSVAIIATRAALAASIAIGSLPLAAGAIPVGASSFTVSLSTSAASSAAGTPVTLTATTNQSITGSGFSIYIYDQTDGGLLSGCSAETNCTTTAVQYSTTTHTYIAYVATSPNYTGSPGGIQATSNTVTVSYSGSVSWTLSLTTTATSAPAGQGVTLTATSNLALAGTGYWFEIFDHTTGAQVVWCITGEVSCTVSASQDVAGTHVFIAYIAPEATTDPPPNVQVTSNTVTVTWTPPTLSLTASPSTPQDGQSTTLSASSSLDVSGTGQYIDIFDHTTRALLQQCSSGSVCTTTSAQSSPTTHSYIAYIAGAGTTDPPPSVQATSSIVNVTWAPPSDGCSAAQVVVFDGYVGGDYLRIRAVTSGTQTIVCYRTYSAAGVGVGGNIAISTPTPQVGTPSTDGNYQACQAAGSPPLVAGTVLGQPVYLDVYTSPSAAWVCVQSGVAQLRIIAPVAVSGTPSATQNSDPTGVTAPAPATGPAGYPSSTCQSSGGAQNIQVLDATVGGTQAWLSAWPVSSSQVDVCARIAGSTAAGGVLAFTVPPVPSLPSGVGLQPVFGTSTTTSPACTDVIAQLSAPTFALLSTSAPSQVNPAVVCVALASVVETVTIGVTGSPTLPPPPLVPLPTVTLDPDTP